ncbi:MAG: rab guanine nucleotide exchange factor S2 [Vezdaea aestivalis]|nr:MAG: rab guanine nucleotide exchange factor S2 [Vezdaea aestivalis]
MAAVTTAPGLPSFRIPRDPEGISTLPDPRSRSMTPIGFRTGTSTPTHHPDLSSEVAALSEKLIRSINHQTELDDSLAQSRHDLDVSRERLRVLEQENEQYRARISGHEWVRRDDADREQNALKSQLAEQQKQRATAETAKKTIELELETLTGALFEEANQMVAASRKERESLQRKNDQLQSQLKDTEFLLSSNQEQLFELKEAMQQLGSEKDDLEAAAALSTAPSTPALNRRDSKDILDGAMDSLNFSDGEKSPACPTTFSELLYPVIRSDLPAFDDFRVLLETGRHRTGHSRVNSGSAAPLVNGLNVIGLGGLTHSPTTVSHNNGSTSSLGTTSTLYSSPATPTTPASTLSNASAREVLNSPPLKDTRFYKRTQVEDVEPTIRLENAPGLSWLARRSVSNAMAEGNIVIESLSSPIVSPRTSSNFSGSSTPSNFNPCALCGEIRSSHQHVRQHRFHISDPSANKERTAQRYSLCGYCVERLRASCDFLSFLRMLREGHWQADGPDSDKAAWEECVKFRERMFWARMGGGVVPTAAILERVREWASRHDEAPDAKSTPRTSTDEEELRIEQVEVKSGVTTEPSADEEDQSIVPEGDAISEKPAVEQSSEVQAISSPDPGEIDTTDFAAGKGPSSLDAKEVATEKSVESTKAATSSKPVPGVEKQDIPGETLSKRESAQSGLSIEIPTHLSS